MTESNTEQTEQQSEETPEAPQESPKQKQKRAEARAKAEAATAAASAPRPVPQPDRPASPAEIAEAQRIVKEARGAIARFHNLRRINNEISAGMRMGVVTPQQAQEIMRAHRDSEMERRAVTQLRELIGIIIGREPTRQELQAGVPPGVESHLGMGSWPVVVTTGIVAVGASVHSIFNYLTTQEESLFYQTASPTERFMYLMQRNMWAVAAVGAAGIAGYMLWRDHKKATPPTSKPEVEQKDEPEKNPDEEDDEDEEDWDDEE